VTKKSNHRAGASSRRSDFLRPEGGPSPRHPTPFRHLAHLPSFRDNPIVFFTTCTYQRRKILASSQCHKILHDIWQRSAEHDGWWVGNYVIMPDHVHFFARPEIRAQRMTDWVEMWKSVSSRRIAAALSIKPPIWQPEYFDRYLDPVKTTQKNGTTLNGTRFGPVSSRLLKRGRIAEQSMI
jgi:putative transposase